MHSIAISKGIKDIAMPEIGCGMGKLRLDDLIASLQPFISDSQHHVTIYSIATWMALVDKENKAVLNAEANLD